VLHVKPTTIYNCNEQLAHTSTTDGICEAPDYVLSAFCS